MKNKFDFTEGEWEYNWKEAEFKVFSENKPICRIVKEFNEDGFLKAEANARLIACAPETIMALIRATCTFEILNNQTGNDPETTQMLKYYTDIIEKATGKKWSEINAKK